MTYVGKKMRRYFSWYTPDRDRPVRVVKKMFKYQNLEETDDASECSYLMFEDSNVIESVHYYHMEKEQ